MWETIRLSYGSSIHPFVYLFVHLPIIRYHLLFTFSTAALCSLFRDVNIFSSLLVIVNSEREENCGNLKSIINSLN